jgi:hypothetical protein
MISFNSLGNLGRLGNQMFQYASLRGISSNRGFEFCIPPQKVFGINDINVKRSESNIHNTFNLSSVNIECPNQKQFFERHYHFDNDLFNNCSDNIDLHGYFQSQKYFKHIENEIRKDFSFDQDTISHCLDFIEQIDSNREIISLHIRRGDYLRLQSHHPILPLEYYSEALKLFPDLPVIIFSDDCEWSLKQELFDHDRFLVSESNTTDFDMCLMSMCSHHIIANSSFSWWGAWLAKSQNVIAPKDWFGESLIHNQTNDIYCDHWIIL